MLFVLKVERRLDRLSDGSWPWVEGVFLSSFSDGHFFFF